ncbi:hypothetical protein, partial [Catellatospora chokoriensis]|uniref:hypothetical protein n=1 Tax=Catellatospora chokoriensis TaxID=310353 RepID=UPI00194298DF
VTRGNLSWRRHAGATRSGESGGVASPSAVMIEDTLHVVEFPVGHGGEFVGEVRPGSVPPGYRPDRPKDIQVVGLLSQRLQIA